MNGISIAVAVVVLPDGSSDVITSAMPQNISSHRKSQMPRAKA